MSKCTKVKNPCKICLGGVTQKTGLRCTGACEGWVHYSCLNYTPGRIQDIKAGIIKVNCPCPDCKTSIPKEFRTDEPFSCTNMQCPANRPPQCENMTCPINMTNFDRMMQTSAMMPPCPLGTCGKDCKTHTSSPTLQACKPPPKPPCNASAMPTMSTSDACIDFNKCPSGCIPSNGDGEMTSVTAMEQMCNTVSLLSKQINELMIRIKQRTPACPPPRNPPCLPSGCNTKGPKGLCPKPCYCADNPKK